MSNATILWLCVWTGDDPPQMVMADGPNADVVGRRVAEAYEESIPDQIYPLGAGNFMATVNVVGATADDDVTVLEPSGELSELIDLLEERAEAGLAGGIPAVVCGAVARDASEQRLSCGLVAGHNGKHLAGDLEW